MRGRGLELCELIISETEIHGFPGAPHRRAASSRARPDARGAGAGGCPRVQGGLPYLLGRAQGLPLGTQKRLSLQEPFVPQAPDAEGLLDALEEPPRLRRVR